MYSLLTKRGECICGYIVASTERSLREIGEICALNARISDSAHLVGVLAAMQEGVVE